MESLKNKSIVKKIMKIIISLQQMYLKKGLTNSEVN